MRRTLSVRDMMFRIWLRLMWTKAYVKAYVHIGAVIISILFRRRPRQPRLRGDYGRRVRAWMSARWKIYSNFVIGLFKRLERHITYGKRICDHLRDRVTRRASQEFCELLFRSHKHKTFYLTLRRMLDEGDVRSPIALGAWRLAHALGLGEDAHDIHIRFIGDKPETITTSRQIAVDYFIQGSYELATSVWRDVEDAREQYIEKQGLAALKLRFIGPSWFMAIGHLAHLDTYFKHRILQANVDDRIIPVMPIDRTVPNSYLLGLWEPFFVPVDERERVVHEARLSIGSVAALQDEFWSLRFGPRDTAMFSRAGARVQEQWAGENRRPLLRLPEEDYDHGYGTLSLMGIPRGAWFVCLHVREPGYHAQWHRKHPATRNADPGNYRDAVREVINRGGYVVRMGDASMTPMPPMDGLVDYAHHPLKSDFMDIFLCATCRFFIGTNSGLGLVPPLFGVPSALTNWSPIGLPQWYPQDLFIPKLIYSRKEERFLTFGELFTTPAGWEQFSDYFDKSELLVIDNDPDDLRDLVVEMFAKLDNELEIPETTLKLRDRFEAMALDSGSYRGARIGSRFLEKYAHLLGSPGDVPKLREDSWKRHRLLGAEIPRGTYA